MPNRNCHARSKQNSQRLVSKVVYFRKALKPMGENYNIKKINCTPRFSTIYLPNGTFDNWQWLLDKPGASLRVIKKY